MIFSPLRSSKSATVTKKNKVTFNLSSWFISFSFLVVLRYSFSRSGMISGTLSMYLMDKYITKLSIIASMSRSYKGKHYFSNMQPGYLFCSNSSKNNLRLLTPILLLSCFESDLPNFSSKAALSSISLEDIAWQSLAGDSWIHHNKRKLQI